MATVRIYKVAELLDLQSTEVLSLLKKEHGIELKSASSSLEEVVARSFVEREARQRNIALPSGDLFSDRPAAPKSALKKPQLVKKAPEPPKPTAPVLGPPRLVKSSKPAAAPVAPAAEQEPAYEMPLASDFEPAEPAAPMAAAPPAVAEAPAAVEPEPAPAPAAEPEFVSEVGNFIEALFQESPS